MSVQAIDELLDRAVETGAVPGVVGIVVAPDGVLYERAAGRLRVDGDAPVVPDTMFRIASMTKALTSVAALQLVEDGRLELEQTVASVLPEFGDLQVLEGFDGGAPRLRPPARPVTVRHLLTHTSGLAYWFGNADLLRWAQATGAPDPLSGRRESIVTPLVHDPGERWEYGVSTDWLGQVVEAISGTTLDAYIEERVAGPLGMPDVTFRPSPAQDERMMAIHTRTPDGGLAPIELQIGDPEFASGGGGASATAQDYGRFLRALLRGGELDGATVLRPETVELMFTDHLQGAPLPEVMRSAVPELTNDVPALPFKQGWGLGLSLVLEDVPGMRRSGTGSWAGLFNCYFWVDRASGVAAALMTQVLPFFDARIVETLLGFEGAVYAHLAAPAPA